MKKFNDLVEPRCIPVINRLDNCFWAMDQQRNFKMISRNK